MGEIADGILNGDFDEVTGEYLGEGQGFPRTVHGERKRKSNPAFGINNWLENSRNVTDKQERYKAIMGYGEEFCTGEKYYQVCEKIQGEFQKFCVWFIDKYQKR